MSQGKKKMDRTCNTVAVCTRLARPVAEELGLQLWDVRFVKEGADWYLRFFIDREGGVTINDCEEMSRRLDKLLDEADPIACSYCLEVSSPGVERELIRPEHFEQFWAGRCRCAPSVLRKAGGNLPAFWTAGMGKAPPLRLKKKGNPPRVFTPGGFLRTSHGGVGRGS